MRRENDFYPTPQSIVDRIVRQFNFVGDVWEPCAGDHRFVEALVPKVRTVICGDIASGQNFFHHDRARAATLVTNPPFKDIRPFIDHAFEIGVTTMVLVCPERLWACKKGHDQWKLHRPTVWANMDWREDYLGKGGAPDRALAVAYWATPHAAVCDYQIWGRDDD